MEIKKAKREEKKIKGCLSAPSGGGKTFSALLLAYGLCKDWNKIAVIDTENKSSSLYSNIDKKGYKLGDFWQICIEAPYTPEKYCNALIMAKKNGIECAIIDSMSHVWNKSGGIIDIADANGGFTGGGWKVASKQEADLWNILLQIPMHIIATMRTEAEYLISKDERGKTKVEKIGTKATQRKDFEYEFDFVLTLNQDNQFESSKDRTGIFEDIHDDKLSILYGEKLLNWSINATPSISSGTVSIGTTVLTDITNSGTGSDTTNNKQLTTNIK